MGLETHTRTVAGPREEWHDRRRDRFGRFAKCQPLEPIQIHVRLSEQRAARLRAAALAARQSLGRYIADAIDNRIRIDALKSRLTAEPDDTSGAPLGGPPME